MLTAEQIKEQIKILHEEAQKGKGKIWDKATDPGADFMTVRQLHLYMGECVAYETLLDKIEELEKDGQDQ